ncbi:polysaccharide pyruvyl transferase family protein [Planococcus donghaensis]|uniref:polysaccharide pyruvyl transferase family protein n=1 Tax=Planococcus donghaensis TaxID=414778 RepID=UPI0037368F24
MKIGIQTFHKTTNYGAILQTYALQKYINDRGIDCEIIDYSSPAITRREEPMKLKNIVSFKDLLKYITGSRAQKLKHKKFDLFIQNFIKISDIHYVKKSLNKASSVYDIIIVGSDQVWNLDLTEKDYSYFLDYASNKTLKCSYAPSFGYEQIPEIYKEESKFFLEQFNYLSVREQQGEAIINELTNRISTVVLDPTFLLPKEQWETISSGDKVKKNYILVYFIHNGDSTFDFIKKLANDYDCEIIYINKTFRLKKGMKNIRSASPNEFLTLLINAEFVVTGSFHGVALSIIMNKQFFYERASNKNNYNSRIDSIITLLNLEEQNILLNENDYSSIDYNLVEGKLRIFKKTSIEYIDKIISVK